MVTKDFKLITLREEKTVQKRLRHKLLKQQHLKVKRRNGQVAVTSKFIKTYITSKEKKEKKVLCF